MSCSMATSIGAYLLGALDATEACQVQAHVAECPSCSRRFEELAALPALLGRLTTQDVDEAGAANDLKPLERTPGPSGSRRAPRLRAWAAPIAAVAAVAAAAVTWIAIPSRTAQTPPVTAQSAQSTWWVRPTVHLTSRSWGTSIDLRLSRAYPAHRCSLVVHTADGRTEVAATWAASAAGRTDVPGATSIPLRDISTVDIVTAAGRQLAEIPVHQSTK